MKKILCVIMLLIFILPVQAFATTDTVNDADIIYLEDGSYFIISLSESASRSPEKSGSKSYTYYSSSGEARWKATLSATFTFDGTEYWTTDCSISVEIYKSNWYEVSKSATMSGCGATGEVTMGQKLLGITVNKESATITLSCSPHGVIT